MRRSRINCGAGPPERGDGAGAAITPSVESVQSSDLAELSSIGTTLDDIMRRIDDMSRRYEGTPREDFAVRLREVERAMGSAVRRLEALLRAPR